MREFRRRIAETQWSDIVGSNGNINQLALKNKVMEVTGVTDPDFLTMVIASLDFEFDSNDSRIAPGEFSAALRALLWKHIQSTDQLQYFEKTDETHEAVRNRPFACSTQPTSTRSGHSSYYYGGSSNDSFWDGYFWGYMMSSNGSGSSSTSVDIKCCNNAGNCDCCMGDLRSASLPTCDLNLGHAISGAFSGLGECVGAAEEFMLPAIVAAFVALMLALAAWVYAFFLLPLEVLFKTMQKNSPFGAVLQAAVALTGIITSCTLAAPAVYHRFISQVLVQPELIEALNATKTYSHQLLHTRTISKSLEHHDQYKEVGVPTAIGMAFLVVSFCWAGSALVASTLNLKAVAENIRSCFRDFLDNKKTEKVSDINQQGENTLTKLGQNKTVGELIKKLEETRFAEFLLEAAKNGNPHLAAVEMIIEAYITRYANIASNNVLRGSRTGTPLHLENVLPVSRPMDMV